MLSMGRFEKDGRELLSEGSQEPVRAVPPLLSCCLVHNNERRAKITLSSSDLTDERQKGHGFSRESVAVWLFDQHHQNTYN